MKIEIRNLIGRKEFLILKRVFLKFLKRRVFYDEEIRGLYFYCKGKLIDVNLIFLSNKAANTRNFSF